MGYVKTKLNVPWVSMNEAAVSWDPRQIEHTDLMYVTVTPPSLSMAELTKIAPESRWKLIHTVVHGPVRNELYQRSR